ncbi:MAG TPA: phage terminase small subunit P27 family [Candidatus Sulfotelmatobacter sp.]|jgi:P27 family predicted phage terminase small subunit
MGAKGSGGHNKKPSKLKAIQGNAGKRKINHREPKPTPGIPLMPAHLAKDPVAKAKWKELVPILNRMGVLTTADGDGLAAYCALFSQWVKCEAAIRKLGMFTADVDETSGLAKIKQNPAVRVKADTLRLMRQFENEFGLTPAARSNLSVGQGRDLEPDVKAQDALQNFIDRKPVSARTQ